MKGTERIKLISNLNPRNFELIIFPTEQCNFRCVYCYEDFKIGKISDDVVVGIKKLIEKNSPYLASLHLSWFGGEPLLALNSVLDISNYANNVGEKNNVSVSGSMTTNGYLLTVETAEKLVNQNIINYQISLDGYLNEHNDTRRLANGKGTFDVIWNNLLALSASQLPFNILLRLHLTASNTNSIYQLASLLNKTLLLDSRFSYAIKAVGDWGGANSKNIKVLSAEDTIKHENQLRAVLGRDKEKSKNLDIETYVCYAAKSNSYVIRADGRVQKCTVALDKEHNTLGLLNKDGTLSIDGKKLRNWMRGFKSGDITELGCPSYNFPQETPKESFQILKLQ